MERKYTLGAMRATKGDFRITVSISTKSNE